MTFAFKSTPAFTIDEYRRRVIAVQQAMATDGIDVIICHDLANICYLTGFQTIGSYSYGHYAAIIPAQGDPALFASDFESHNAALDCWIDDIVVYKVMDDLVGGSIGHLADLLKQRGYEHAKAGYESGFFSMTITQFDQLKCTLPHVSWVDVTSMIDRVKMIKSPVELEALTIAAHAASVGLRTGQQKVRTGITDNDVAAAIYDAVIKDGAEYFNLQPVVTAGNRSGIPHSTFRRNQLVEGDVVFMEVCAVHKRYNASGLRTVVIGKPGDEVKRAHDACLAGVTTVIDHLRSGASAQDAARHAGNALRAIEPDLVWHGYYGYSVGLAFPPACTDCQHNSSIVEQEELILQPGMVFHCSVSLRKVRHFGVTVGDTVVVTEQGHQVLTNAPRELIVK